MTRRLYAFVAIAGVLCLVIAFACRPAPARISTCAEWRVERVSATTTTHTCQAWRSSVEGR